MSPVRLSDWRSSGALTSDLPILPLPLAGEPPAPGRWNTRYILRFRCGHCQALWLAAASVSMKEPCPACGHLLARVDGVWDLSRERSPTWWSDEPEDRL